jgi:hypothetical protein
LTIVFFQTPDAPDKKRMFGRESGMIYSCIKIMPLGVRIVYAELIWFYRKIKIAAYLL